MKKLMISILLPLFISALIACNTEAPSNQVDEFDQGSVYYFRTSWSELQYFSASEVIESFSDLEAYLSKMASEDYYNRDILGFFEENVDETLFDNYHLIVLVVEEPSGSNRHAFKSFEVHDDTLHIEFDRIIPEIGTSDMAAWHIVLVYEKEHFEFNDIDVKIN